MGVALLHSLSPSGPRELKHSILNASVLKVELK